MNIRSSIARFSTIHERLVKDITERLKRQGSSCVELSRESGRLASTELSELLLRSNKEPEIVPDLTQKLSLWQRLEWSSRVHRRQQQWMLFDPTPQQLEFEF